MEYKKRNSIKFSLVIHLFIALLLAIVVSMLINVMTEQLKNDIWLKYVDDVSGYYEMYNEFSEKYKDVIPVPQAAINEMSEKDGILIGICDFAQSWCGLFFMSAAVVTSLSLFYKKRLKVPLDILEDSAVKIAKQELEFSVAYPKRDEMGHLCESFEKMRRQLYVNNATMWKMIDEQKQMRSTFSHDLRTPISVLKGYVEYLIRYFPQGRLSDEKVMETLQDLAEQTGHIENFADTMKDINYLDDIQINKQNIDVSVINKKTEAILKTLVEKYERESAFSSHFQSNELCLDMDIYMEILENIVANAVRFSKSTVGLELYEDETGLSLMIYDDGPGFKPEEITNAIKPYYHGDNAKGQHYGMGLYICNILCQKHGGDLTLNNLSTGGASVNVRFENV